MKHAWIRIDLTPQQIEGGALDRVRDECCRWYLAAETPPGALLFEQRPGSHRPADVAVELYFSPIMARICREAIAAFHPAGTTDCPVDAARLLVGALDEMTVETSDLRR